MIFTFSYQLYGIRLCVSNAVDAFQNGHKKAPPYDEAGPAFRLELFTRETRRAFFEKGGDAFLKIVGFARFELAFMF